MTLEVYLERIQVEDFGDPLLIGDLVEVELLGNPGGHSTAIPPLPAFQPRLSNKSLRKIGIAEYAFSGKILQVETLTDFGGEGTVYQEVLVDCGIPVIITSSDGSGFFGAIPRPGSNLTAGAHLRGLMLLRARLSFRYPALIERPLKAKVVSLSALDFSSSNTDFSLRELGGIDAPKAIPDDFLGFILGIEVQDPEAGPASREDLNPPP